MTTFTTFTCEFEHEACGACIGCQTRTIPGTDYFFGCNPFEARLLEELPRRSGSLAAKSWKLRGVDPHKGARFRADVVVHALTKRNINTFDTPWEECGVTEDEFFAKCDTFLAEEEEMAVQAGFFEDIPSVVFEDLDATREDGEAEAIFDITSNAINSSVPDRMKYFTDYFMRYPEKLSRGQSSLFGKYQVIDACSDSLADYIESLALFGFMIMRARNYTDRVIALVTIAKLMNEKLSLPGIAFVTLQSALEHFCGSHTDMDVQASVLPDFETLRDFLDKYDTIKQSPLFAKVYKFSMYGLSLALFKPVGIDLDLLKFDKVAQEAVRKQYHLGPDFVHCMLDTTLFLCERGYQAYQLGSFMPLFHSEAKYQEWFDQSEKLLRQAQFLSNPTVHGIDRSAFLSDLKDLIEKGRCMKKCSQRKEEKLLISRLLASLELTHDLEITKRAAQKDRRSPLSFLLFGGSGIGKTTLENIIFQQYGKRRGKRTTSEYRYVRNPTEEYWSGYNSTQWCIVLDDIGFMNPSMGIMDPSLAEMLCVANNVPYVPAQAELSDKGRTPVLAELLLGSTNTESLNLAAYFSCPLAVQRRFPWIIDIRVKLEFQSDTRPGMLDSAKVPTVEEGAYPDLWTFVIKRVVPVGEERNRQKGENVVVENFDSMRPFLKWLNKVIDEHNEVQDVIERSNNTMEATKLCHQCGMPTAWCECLTVQSREMAVYRRPEYLNVEPLTFTRYAQKLPVRERCVVNFYLFVYWLFTTSWFAGFLTVIFGDWFVYNMIMRSQHKMLLLRSVVSYSGYRVQQKIGAPAYLVKICAAATALFVLYKGGKYMLDFGGLLGPMMGVKTSAQKDEQTPGKHCADPDCIHAYYNEDECVKVRGETPQGNVAPAPLPRVDTSKYEDTGSDPVPQTSARVRPTYEDPFPYSSDDLSQASLCATDSTMLMKHIERATCAMQSRGDGKIYNITLVNVRGGVYMTNNHGVPTTCPFYMNLTCAPQGNMGVSMKGLLITDSMVHRMPEHDLAFILLRCRAPGTDLTKYMCKSSFVGKLEGTYIGRDVSGESWKRHVPVVVAEQRTWKTHGRDVTGDVWCGKTQNPTVDGDCGSFMVSDTPVGPVILGIHLLGRADRVGALRITQELVRRGCDALEPVHVNRGSVQVSAPSAPRAVGPLDIQSAVRRATPGVANVMGSFTGEFRMRGRTNVTTTYIEPFLRSWGYEANRTRPMMSKTPWVLALNDTTRPVVLVDNDKLDLAKAMYIKETSDVDLSGVHVYSLHVAINGCPGLDYCDKMNRKSSAGAPYKKSKKHFMFYLDESISTDMDVVDEVKETVFSMIETYKRGDRCHPVFCGHLKDEPVTFEKAALGKTRVFTASGIAYTLVVRKYLLSVIVLMQNNRYKFETGPGLVPQSLEWEQVREHITQFGEDRLVAGDYSKFDKRMPANVILAAFDVIYDICKRAGYTEDDLRVVRGIAYDTAFPTVDFNGDLIEFYGSNPSGHPLTVIINGIVNSLYMRYCYVVLRPLDIQSTFTDHVALMTYGDDNIMGVSPDAPWFNHTAIQHTLALVDIGYTMADKEAASVPYINIDSTNFLKRTWRWDEDVGAYLAPLDRSSIEKMLTVCTLGKNVSRKSHAISVLSTALREYFFYGKQEFAEKTAIFWQVVHDADLDLYVEDSTFPTWEELKQAFWDNSEGISIRRLN
nr:MAG: hypothetical protein 1 [Marnaviridae sp.]